MRVRMRSMTAMATLVAVLALCGGCGGKSARAVNDLNGIPEGDLVLIEGELTLHGSTPFPTLVIETSTGASVTIDSRDSEVQHELKGLASMRVTVEGTVLAGVDRTSSRLDVVRYELLPLPGGEIPMVGVLSIEDTQCVLTAKGGTRYWIRGDLADVIREYDGARVWVVGIIADTTAPGRPKKATPFTPTGYGVIDEVSDRSH